MVLDPDGFLPAAWESCSPPTDDPGHPPTIAELRDYQLRLDLSLFLRNPACAYRTVRCYVAIGFGMALRRALGVVGDTLCVTANQTSRKLRFGHIFYYCSYAPMLVWPLPFTRG